MQNNKDVYKRIIITDKDGRVIVSTDGKEKENYNKEGWWITAYNGISHVSDFYAREGYYSSTGSIEFLVDVAIPIIDWREAEVVGVIKGSLSGEWMARTVINTWIGHTGHTMLITSEGFVAICPLELLKGDKDLHKVDDLTMKGLENISPNAPIWTIVKDNTHDSKDAITGFAFIKLPPDINKTGKQSWYIFVTQDSIETYAPLYATLQQVLIFGFILICVFSIGSYYFAQRMVRPITTLRDGADTLASGKIDIQLPVLSEDELGQMTTSFNKMAASIKEETEEIQRKNREWDNTFNSVTDILVIYDKDYRIVKVNKAFADFVNSTPLELTGKKCSEAFLKNNKIWSVCSYSTTLETGNIYHDEVADAEKGTHHMLTTSPLLDEKGEFIGSVLVARDITEYKKLQAQLLHTEKLAAVGELASGVAHELNNPLTGIMGFSELLLEMEKDKKKKDIMKKMFNESERARNIIRNLLSFVRADKQEFIQLGVNKVILDTLELKKYELKTNNIEITKKLAPSLPDIKGNYYQLQQVVLNILINAQMALLEADKKNKKIIIQTRMKKDNKDEQHIEISIKDNGTGIAPENLSKIFNPFFTTKEAGKGTGLGLSVSYGIIKEHNGRIFAESNLGEGAAFYIELPVII
ncbi:MAG: PAS domain-containing protein [Nitrospirae bacterium]|nr:PAS domain-containing protein [Nitrospirota bacterium]